MRATHSCQHHRHACGITTMADPGGYHYQRGISALASYTRALSAIVAALSLRRNGYVLCFLHLSRSIAWSLSANAMTGYGPTYTRADVTVIRAARFLSV